MSKEFRQHPDALIRRRNDWAKWLGSAEIAHSEWIAPGLTVSGAAVDGDVTSAILSAPAEGETVWVTNRVTSTDGREKDYSFTLTGAIDVLEKINKDPDDRLVATLGTRFFDDDLTIASTEWEAESGLTLGTTSIGSTSTSAELTGGTAGATVRVTNLATMSSGEVLAGVLEIYITEN